MSLECIVYGLLENHIGTVWDSQELREREIIYMKGVANVVQGNKVNKRNMSAYLKRIETFSNQGFDDLLMTVRQMPERSVNTGSGYSLNCAWIAQLTGQSFPCSLSSFGQS